MKLLSVIVALVLVVSGGCAKKTTGSAAPQAPGTSSGAGSSTAVGGRGGGAGVQAAARLTADDLDARMKVIGPAAGALRMKLTNNQLSDAAKDGQTLAVAFGDVERFFQQQNRT